MLVVNADGLAVGIETGSCGALDAPP